MIKNLTTIGSLLERIDFDKKAMFVKVINHNSEDYLITASDPFTIAIKEKAFVRLLYHFSLAYSY